MFIVIEMQENAAGKVSHIVTDHATEAEAESKFHSILSYAAVSDVPIHSACVLTSDGFLRRSQCYKHQNNEEE